MIKTIRSTLALAALISFAFGCGGEGTDGHASEARTITFSAEGATNARTTPMDGQGSNLIEAGDIAVTVSNADGLEGLRRLELHVDPAKLVDGVATVDGKTTTVSYLDQPDAAGAQYWFASGGKVKVVAKTDGTISLRLTDVVLYPAPDSTAIGVLKINGAAHGGRTL